MKDVVMPQYELSREEVWLLKEKTDTDGGNGGREDKRYRGQCLFLALLPGD